MAISNYAKDKAFFPKTTIMESGRRHLRPQETKNIRVEGIIMIEAYANRCLCRAKLTWQTFLACCLSHGYMQMTYSFKNKNFKKIFI